MNEETRQKVEQGLSKIRTYKLRAYEYMFSITFFSFSFARACTSQENSTISWSRDVTNSGCTCCVHCLYRTLASILYSQHSPFHTPTPKIKNKERNKNLLSNTKYAIEQLKLLYNSLGRKTPHVWSTTNKIPFSFHTYTMGTLSLYGF